MGGTEGHRFSGYWSVGLSFFHNLFAREHNVFVEEFRKEAERRPEADSGLRDPLKPEQIVRYKDVTPDELFEITRLVIAAQERSVRLLREVYG